MIIENIKENPRPLRESIQQHYYSHQLENERMDKLLKLQKQFLNKKEERIFWGPIFISSLLVLLLFLNFYQKNSVELNNNSEFSDIIDNTVNIHVASTLASNPQENNTAVPIDINQHLEKYFAGLEAFSRIDQLPQVLSKDPRWKITLAETGTSNHSPNQIYNIMDLDSMDQYTMLISKQKGVGLDLNYPIHTIKSGLNVRLWKENDKIISIVGSNIKGVLLNTPPPSYLSGKPVLVSY